MKTPTHCYPAGATHHKADRHCPCAPTPMVDMATGTMTVFVHRRPEPVKAALKGDALADRMGTPRG